MNFIDTLKKYVGLIPSGGAVRIGRAKKFLRPAEWITEKELGHHIHIVGASGFGKTVLISHILRSRIEAGRGVLFIDQKGDLETIARFGAIRPVISVHSDRLIRSKPTGYFGAIRPVIHT